MKIEYQELVCVTTSLFDFRKRRPFLKQIKFQYVPELFGFILIESKTSKHLWTLKFPIKLKSFLLL
jgi:hypothetical protein